MNEAAFLILSENVGSRPATSDQTAAKRSRGRPPRQARRQETATCDSEGTATHDKR